MWVTITEDIVVDPNDISFILKHDEGGCYIHMKNQIRIKCPLTVQEVMKKLTVREPWPNEKLNL